MSATPIPRTLNMSLVGIRDMSIIETPPQDRLSIQTNVVKFDQEVIGRAIRNELTARGGQVYFVHTASSRSSRSATSCSGSCPRRAS
jgi:transcription-repair coupling factor (superfamily II helicase)